MKFEELNNIIGGLEKHISIIGTTNSGKTTVAKMLHTNTNYRSIFFNSQDEAIDGYRVHKWDISLLKEHKKINFIPNWKSDMATNQLQQITDDLREIALSTGDRSRKTEIVVFVDEAHNIALQGQHDTPLHWIFKQGHRHMVTGVSITQSPADLDKGIVRQADFHIIFRVNDFESQYFKAKNIPIELVKDQLVDHKFTIYDNTKFLGIFELDL